MSAIYWTCHMWSSFLSLHSVSRAFSHSLSWLLLYPKISSIPFIFISSLDISNSFYFFIRLFCVTGYILVVLSFAISPFLTYWSHTLFDFICLHALLLCLSILHILSWDRNTINILCYDFSTIKKLRRSEKWKIK